ncbi:hypothetical protein ACFYXM_06985 [Streptomyces sp. NPDC002476]|uniref:hypothetical protein n=1 Tax=Streptomyces sp. NPDC002476 TaxID=3364648 RepID=UPI0036AC9848
MPTTAAVAGYPVTAYALINDPGERLLTVRRGRAGGSGRGVRTAVWPSCGFAFP